MKVFISYASEDVKVAREVEMAVRGGGHDVFIASMIKPSGEFHARIRKEIKASDVFVWLISPDSVAPGGYALTELAFAKTKWPAPWGHVVPVEVRGTPLDAIDPYVTSANIVYPVGNIAAETAAAIENRYQGPSTEDRGVGARTWPAYVGASVAAAGSLIGIVITWLGPWSLPLDGRAAIAAMAGVLAAVALTLVFDDLADEPTGSKRWIKAIVAGAFIGALTVWLLRLSVVAHSLVIDDTCHASKPGWHCIGVRAPSRPISLEWRFSLAEPQFADAEWEPGFEDAIGTPTTEFDDTSLTVGLTGFVSPQRYGVAYRTRRSEGRIDQYIQNIKPETTPRVQTSVLRIWMIGFVIGGLCVWAFASWSFYSSARWRRPVSLPRG